MQTGLPVKLEGKGWTRKNMTEASKTGKKNHHTLSETKLDCAEKESFRLVILQQAEEK